MNANKYFNVIVLSLAACLAPGSLKTAPVHTTYHWHLHQPIYWADRTEGKEHTYEKAYDSAVRKEHGAQHPEDNLEEIFAKDDRVAAYQYRIKDAIGTISQADGGAQVSYSGSLWENVESLASHYKYGYYAGWQGSFQEARNWTTSGKRPKLDMVIFPFHHCLAPLVDINTLRKEIKLYKLMYPRVWGASPGISAGFFPPELAFSERMIPVLDAEGIDWTFVANSHISRACKNFPVKFGSGGEMCDPPNESDKINPRQDNWFCEFIDRGCSPANAYPYAYRPHYARHVNPESGEESRVVVVPVDMVLSWRDGYSKIGVEGINEIAWANEPEHPMLIVMGHDGDNAYGGGYSYYMENVHDFCNVAASAGYEPTVVAEYLSDHPVGGSDVVHVEDGAWVNADGDFGSPAFWNWNWPLVGSSGGVDIKDGWALDERNWAVITAAQNRVETAEQIAGGTRIAAILDPYGFNADDAELAWHFFLPAVTSCFMYWGAALDIEVKPSLSCNIAMEHADAVIKGGAGDRTPPTIWVPQRYPYNPGGKGFGSLYGYKEVEQNRDFWTWTFVYDVSGVDSVNFYYRIDLDGYNSPSSDQNETFAGGNEVTAWKSLPMTKRAFPPENLFGDPQINFFIMPEYTADEYYLHFTEPEVVDSGGVLIDYFVKAVDAKGYEKATDIFHVYIGTGGSSSKGPVFWIPEEPAAGDTLWIYYDPVQGALPNNTNPVYIHIGNSGWKEIIVPDPEMVFDTKTTYWKYGYASPSYATSVDFVFTDGHGNWDNNNGKDWHVPLKPPEIPFVMDGFPDSIARPLLENGDMTLWVSFDRTGAFLYVAVTSALPTTDHFIFFAQKPGTPVQSPWAKAGTVAQWDGYLAQEGENSFSGWFNIPETVRKGSSASQGHGTVLEGYFNVEDLYGYVPAKIYLAAASYGTKNGDPLLWQVPGSGPPSNGNIEAGEYFLNNLLINVRAETVPASASMIK